MREEAQNVTVGAQQTETETETESISTTSKKGAVLFGKYEVQRLLGVGASARVYHATNVDTGQSVAVKVVNKNKVMKSGFATNIEREITIMRRLHHHPHIVKLFEVLASKTKIYFVMEFVSGGELFEEVPDGGQLSEDLSRKYFRQLISAVRYCHSHGVFHRDLKLDNLLIDEDKNLKVTDFGLSAVKDPTRPDRLLQTVCGTPAYVAPEILAKKGYDGAKVDVWSCGIVLYALTAGYLPFNDYNIAVLYRKIYRGQFRFPKWMSPDLKNLLSRMLDTNPKTRIKIDEILQDTWFKTTEQELKPDPIIFTTKHEWDETRTGVKSLNAFDLISFSTGLNMSGLLVNSEAIMDNVQRVISREPSESIMEKVEEVAKRAKVTIMRKENGCEAKLDGQDGNFVALIVFYRLTDELLVVELKMKEKQKGSSAQFWKSLRSKILELTS
ncbi:hypothetical protein RIF29_00211 [Crotalaria pallida]|uniref:non-specific serine/threonine protein kinase n=1 Tax=Crotalaria pallida TaxID=3830 RepID=A0AAN9IVG4_CROPI